MNGERNALPAVTGKWSPGERQLLDHLRVSTVGQHTGSLMSSPMRRPSGVMQGALEKPISVEKGGTEESEQSAAW